MMTTSIILYNVFLVLTEKVPSVTLRNHKEVGHVRDNLNEVHLRRLIVLCPTIKGKYRYLFPSWTKKSKFKTTETTDLKNRDVFNVWSDSKSEE